MDDSVQQWRHKLWGIGARVSPQVLENN